MYITEVKTRLNPRGEPIVVDIIETPCPKCGGKGEVDEGLSLEERCDRG